MTLPNPVKYHVYEEGTVLWPQLYDYVLHGGGVLKVAKSDYIAASVSVAKGRITGLPVDKPKWVCTLPRIPLSCLGAVLRHARCAGEALTPVEQMYHFHWIDKEWRVAAPKQNASAGRVTYQGGDAPSIVLDLHSHHTMNAYFSETDDQDEQGFRFYAVIGRIYDRPEIRLRLGVYGDFVELPASTLFEGLGPFEDAYERTKLL